MSKRRFKPEFTALDALRVASMPHWHVVPSLAATILQTQPNSPLDRSRIQQVAELFAAVPDDVDGMVDRISAEISRQFALKARRITRKRTLSHSAAIGGQLPRTERIQRVCRSIFGPAECWRPAFDGRNLLDCVEYGWLQRADSSVLVTGFDALTANNNWVCGYAFKTGPTGVAQFAQLPARTRNIVDLFLILGLPKRMVGGRNFTVDWVGHAFYINTTKINWWNHSS